MTEHNSSNKRHINKAELQQRNRLGTASRNTIVELKLVLLDRNRDRNSDAAPNYTNVSLCLFCLYWKYKLQINGRTCSVVYLSYKEYNTTLE